MGAIETPEGLTPISVGGKMYFVDDAAIAGLKERGIQYTSGADTQKQWESTGETGRDMARGVIHGGTLGFADAKFGDSNQSVAQRVGGEDYNTVKERSPVASGVGDFAGSMALPVPGGGAALAGRGAAAVAGRIGLQGAVGAGMGAARAVAEGEDPVNAGALGGALGAGGAGLVEGAGWAASKAAPYVKQALDATADAARARGVFAVGGSDAKLSALAQRFGVDKIPAKIAALIEQVVPQDGAKIGLTRDQYREILESQANTYGPLTTGMRQRAGEAEGVNSIIPQEYQTMRQNLQDKLKGLPRLTAKDDALANALESDLGRLDTAKQPKTLEELAALKSHYQAAGHEGIMGTVPERAAAEAAANIGGEGKETLNRLMEYATDDTKNMHRMANDKTADIKMLLQQIEPKAIREQLDTNAAAGVGATIAGGLGGAALGAGTAALTDNDVSKGAMLGASAGIGGGAMTGTNNFTKQMLARPQAMDTIANFSRAAGKALKDIDLIKLQRYIQSAIGKGSGYAAESD
jgi:hypothetical protein